MRGPHSALPASPTLSQPGGIDATTWDRPARYARHDLSRCAVACVGSSRRRFDQDPFDEAPGPHVAPQAIAPGAFLLRGFACKQVRAWAADFVHWYNVDHRHSGIRYVSPAQRHAGEDKAILAARHAVYQNGRELHPARWSAQTRNWTPVGAARYSAVGCINEATTTLTRAGGLNPAFLIAEKCVHKPGAAIAMAS